MQFTLEPKKHCRGKGRFVHNFLSFDELPSTIETNSELYNIVKYPRRFGFLRDTPALGDYENFANTLQCLKVSDVSDAMLLCVEIHVLLCLEIARGGLVILIHIAEQLKACTPMTTQVRL